MKIAITGTRGIPNRYGGFEQLAERLSSGLAERGHEVWVYNPQFHPFSDDNLGKVRIVHRWSPERLGGSAANFLYDYLCLKNAIKKKVDVILECGYASAAPSYPWLRFSRTKLVTHMDGMEWQRTKWNRLVKWMTRYFERLAVRKSDLIVADNPAIQEYYKSRYGAESVYIPYGADPVSTFDNRILKDQM